MPPFMAESNDRTMARLDRLEAAFVHVTDLLVLQSERMDVGFRSLRDEMHAGRQEMQSLRGEVSGLREETRATREEMREETRTMREALSDRLDRLIAITLKERTTGIERLASIEERLAKLERHVGV